MRTLVVVAVALVMLAAACDGDDPDPASNEVKVSENLTPIASYPDQQTAATFIQSQTGGLLITQSDIPSGPEPSWEEISGPGAGSYYRQELVDGGASYHLHTTDRTYSLVTHTVGGITDDEAVRILGGFLQAP
ncbi:MAG: hypothetical protein WD557_17835 [Dehalococcoidia bacterium]